MYKAGRSRFLPVVVIIIAMALVVAALVSIGQLIFSGSNSEAPEGETTDLSSELLTVGDDRGVSMTVRGPIVADEKFRSYQIVISGDRRQITSWEGYNQNDTIDNRTLPNDEKAYRQFVNALNYAGFTRTDKVDSDDTYGLCADGRVYDFEILAGSDVIDHRWTTNCGIKGSFRGNGDTIRSLFIDQIPDADEIVNEVDL